MDDHSSQARIKVTNTNGDTNHFQDKEDELEEEKRKQYQRSTGRRNAITPGAHHIEPIRQVKMQAELISLKLDDK